MWDHGWWGMLTVWILYRVGVDIVVLRWDIVARRIVSRHDGTAVKERRSRGVVVVGDGTLGINVIQGLGLQGFEVDRPCLTMALRQGPQVRGFEGL